MPVVRLDARNRIVLPKEAREAMHLKGKDELLVVVKGGITIIMPRPGSYSRSASGLGKGIYIPEHIKKERHSW